MTVAKIRMLGKLSIEDRDANLVELKGQRAQELLCYLLLNRERFFPRDILADILWKDVDPCLDVTKRMRQAVWQLQTALSTVEQANKVPIIQIDANWIKINPKVQLWIDVNIVEKAYAHCQGRCGAELDVETIARLQEAVALYRGELLENWYEDWCIYERERLQIMYLTVLDKLMDYYETYHEYEISITYGLQILKQDRRECTHYRLMRLFAKFGDRTSALRQFERCAAALDKELGVQPAEETATLQKQIAAGLYRVTSSDRLVIGTQRHLLDIQQRLEQLQNTIISIQSQVKQELQTTL